MYLIPSLFGRDLLPSLSSHPRGVGLGVKYSRVIASVAPLSIVALLDILFPGHITNGGGSAGTERIKSGKGGA